MPIFFQVCFCYLGALIGAGFASGKEIQLFFGRFSVAAYSSLLLAGILFAFLAYATIELCRKYRLLSAADFFIFCLGRRLGLFMLHFLQVFLFFSVTVMIAAGDSLFQIFFLEIPGVGGVLLCCCLYLFLLRPQKGMVIINTALVPVLLVMLFFLWHNTIDWQMIQQCWNITDGVSIKHYLTALFWALLYVSYNFFGISTILIPFGIGSRKKTPAYGGFLAGMILGALLFFATLALLSDPILAEGSPMPFLALAMEQGVGIVFYGVALFAAIVTTALANSFTLLQNITPLGKVLFLTVAFLIAYHWDFSGLVSFLYPFTGLLGLFLIFAICYRFFTS